MRLKFHQFTAADASRWNFRANPCRPRERGDTVRDTCVPGLGVRVSPERP